MELRTKYLIAFIALAVITLLTTVIGDILPMSAYLFGPLWWYTLGFGLIALLFLVKVAFPDTKVISKIIYWLTHLI